MSVSALYELYIDCGAKAGIITGLFIADADQVEKVIGKEVSTLTNYMGRQMVTVVLEEEHIALRSNDQRFISECVSVFDGETLAGFNPVSALDLEEEFDV